MLDPEALGEDEGFTGAVQHGLPRGGELAGGGLRGRQAAMGDGQDVVEGEGEQHEHSEKDAGMGQG